MRDHLGELAMLGIANRMERNKGELGGRYYEYNLDTSSKLLLQALQQTVDIVGKTETIQQRFGDQTQQ